MDLQEDCLAQVACHPFADLDRVVVVTDGKDGIQDRNAQHQEEGIHDHLHVLSNDALVDDALHQARDGQVHDNHGGQQHQRKGRLFPVRFEKAKEFGDLVHGLEDFFERFHRAGQCLDFVVA